MTGTYTEITSLIVPQSANPGDIVTISVGVKNLHPTGSIKITLTGKVGATAVYFGNVIHIVAPGAIVTFTQQFIMPSVGVSVQVWSHYWGVGEIWVQDDSAEATMSILEEPPVEEISGEILNKWINKSPEGSHIFMPAVVSPDGNTFEVGVQYKNTSSITITAGCEVVVTDPDGNVRASPAVDYSGMSPGRALSTEYNISRVDKPGDWLVRIRFLRSDGTELDKFEGICLGATGASGRIKSVWVNKDPEGSNLPVPASVAADYHSFEVGIEYENTSDFGITAGVSMVVRAPDGEVRASPSVDYAGMVPGKVLRKEYNVCPVDMGGRWTVVLELVTKEGLVLDTFTGTCLNAIGGTAEIQLAWINKTPEGSRLSIPTEVGADRNTFEIGAQYKSNFSFDITAGIEVKVWDPDNILRASPPIDFSGMTPGRILSKEYNICQVDKEGPWTVEIKLVDRSGLVLDTYETAGNILFTAVSIPGEPPIEEFILIRDHRYALAPTYYGQAERSTVTFSVVAPSFMLTDDKIAEIVTSLEDKFAEIGAHMLELKLYEDRGLVQSNYSAVITTTIPTETTEQTAPTLFGISTGVFIAIIIAVCLIVGLIVILVVRRDVNQFLFGTPPTNGEPGVPGVMDLIGNMVVIMMMVMMMETMGPMLAPEGAPPRPKPVTEAVVKAAKVTGRAVVKAVPVAVKAVKEVAERFKE